MIGKTLAHYEITSLLGKGGMGEVYQATDEKLGREVAIKVLPEEFAKDADRVARFQREAKLLASLNHPNIAAIYGLEESGGTNFLVLEFIEGETLANRIKTGPIPVEEALNLALQIAEALEAAHERGVIHRDLKPANIKVTPEDKVKVLDFGLAKAFAGEQADLNLTNSPTLSIAATRQGIILGTAAYMSPEQARGKPVDKRADIWAFGVVLFEMLTGRPLFVGEDVSSTLARVLEREPDFSALPMNLHPRIRLLLERCLEKESKNRYHDIADARVDIQDVLTDSSGVFVQPVTAAEPRKRKFAFLWATAVALVAFIAALVTWNLKKAEPTQVTRLYSELVKKQQFGHPLERAIAVSKDGRRFVYSTPEGLYFRSLDEFETNLIVGTEGAQSPFFSPDGKWVGYWSAVDDKLMKIAIGNGVPIPITDALPIYPATWLANNTILYSYPGRGIMRVSSDGGVAEEIIKAEDNEMLGTPQMLPDGETVLVSFFRRNTEDGGVLSSGVSLHSLQSGKRKLLFENAMYAQYLRTGHILYIVEDDLFAVPFDVDKLRVTGSADSLGVKIYRLGLWPQYAVSDAGTLVYVRQETDVTQNNCRTLVWVDMNGNEEEIAARPEAFSNPRISPNGKKVVLNIEAGENMGISIWDQGRKNLEKLSFDKSRSISRDTAPLWTPNGEKIVYLSFREANYTLNWKAVHGAGLEEPLVLNMLGAGGPASPACWSEDGNVLILMKINLRGTFNTDIIALPMEGDRRWEPLLQEDYSESQPRISTNGQWMAYTSDRSGRNEVYIRPFPDVNKRREQVSINGGSNPLWSPNGRKLYYLNGDTVIAVPVKMEPSFNVGTPEVLFQGTYVHDAGTPNPWSDISFWDIHPDGDRFLMIKPSRTIDYKSTEEFTTQGPRQINIVLNWFEELKQRVPVP